MMRKKPNCDVPDPVVAFVPERNRRRREDCAGEAENVAGLSKLGCVERIERLCTELRVDAIPRSY